MQAKTLSEEEIKTFYVKLKKTGFTRTNIASQMGVCGDVLYKALSGKLISEKSYLKIVGWLFPSIVDENAPLKDQIEKISDKTHKKILLQEYYMGNDENTRKMLKAKSLDEAKKIRAAIHSKKLLFGSSLNLETNIWYPDESAFD